MPKDDLELLRDALDGVRGIAFARYAEASFWIEGHKKRVWVRAPSRVHDKWRVTFSGEQPRVELDSLHDVVVWFVGQRKG